MWVLFYTAWVEKMIRTNEGKSSKENTWMPPAVKEITARCLEDIPTSKPVATANLSFKPPTQEDKRCFFISYI